jgi:hypothetical protein
LGTPPVQPGQHPPAILTDQPNRDLSPHVTITARQLLHEVTTASPSSAATSNAPFNALWDPFDDNQLESDSRTEPLIIDEADRLRPEGWNNSGITSTATTWA